MKTCLVWNVFFTYLVVVSIQTPPTRPWVTSLWLDSYIWISIPSHTNSFPSTGDRVSSVLWMWEFNKCVTENTEYFPNWTALLYKNTQRVYAAGLNLGFRLGGIEPTTFCLGSYHCSTKASFPHCYLTCSWILWKQVTHVRLCTCCCCLSAPCCDAAVSSVTNKNILSHAPVSPYIKLHEK